jgi:hypothetical protein
MAAAGGVEKRVKLAAGARTACAKGDYEGALSALAGLKAGLERSEDVAWVERNVDSVRAAADAARADGAAATSKRPRFFPRLANVEWRVDVSISTSSLERVMKPSVCMVWTLDDGSIKTFEMDVPQFEKLRYDVARLLRSMQEVERHPIMRIVD